jgi:hypothetical protein
VPHGVSHFTFLSLTVFSPAKWAHNTDHTMSCENELHCLVLSTVPTICLCNKMTAMMRLGLGVRRSGLNSAPQSAS